MKIRQLMKGMEMKLGFTLVLLCSMVFAKTVYASQVKPANQITIISPQNAAVHVGSPNKTVKRLHTSLPGRYAGTFSLKAGVECAFPFKVNFPGTVKAATSWKGAKFCHVQIVPFPYDKVSWKRFRSVRKVSRHFGLKELAKNKSYCLLIKNTSKSGIAFGKAMVDTPHIAGDLHDLQLDDKFEAAKKRKRPNHILAKFAISPGVGGGRIIRFKNRWHGIIKVEGHWNGTSKVKFILDAPGGKNASQAGKTGKSPLVFRYKVKAKDLKAGNKWRLSIRAPKAKGSARGFVKITLPTPGK